MASIAARAERLALAVQAVEESMGRLAAARGVEAPPLPTSRDPGLTHALRLETIAGFLDTLVAEPEQADTVRKRKG